jgi:hypothetical protein
MNDLVDLNEPNGEARPKEEEDFKTRKRTKMSLLLKSSLQMTRLT